MTSKTPGHNLHGKAFWKSCLNFSQFPAEFEVVGGNVGTIRLNKSIFQFGGLTVTTSIWRQSPLRYSDGCRCCYLLILASRGDSFIQAVGEIN